MKVIKTKFIGISSILFLVSSSSFFIIFLSSCNNEKPHFNLQFTEIPTACKSGGQGNLFVDNNEIAYLSWVEYLNDTTDALLFSKMENDHWSVATTIATGNDWFVNWADFPSLAVSDDGKTLAAHWLQKSALGTYDYDVRIAQSSDEGKTWSESFIIHRDSIAAEHGFVTMIPSPEHQIFAVWLDGRNTKSESDSAHSHGHSGAMSLRTAQFDKAGNLYEETELDSKICDCCQTDAAMTAKGPVVVYRDRSEDEIRDISIVRKIGADWTQPRNISQDKWKITGCPVNGPVIAADQNKVVVSWFTAANEIPKVKAIFSDDCGASFSKPIQIDNGNPVGRVDVVLKNDQIFISWLEAVDTRAIIMLAIFDLKTLELLDKKELVNTSPSRKSGFPVLEKVHGKLLLAWTEVNEKKTVVKTAFIE